MHGVIPGTDVQFSKIIVIFAANIAIAMFAVFLKKQTMNSNVYPKVIFFVILHIDILILLCYN